jgi:uridine kinase
MAMSLPAGEPAAGSWQAVRTSELMQLVAAATRVPNGRARVLAVDGRGGSGKSTLAERLRRGATRSALLDTDDLAWHEPLFGWGHLLARVLEPLRRGEPVRFQPPAWARHGRRGAIEVPAGLDLVIVEGTGASQREVAALVDAAIWVQADFAEAERQGIERDVAEGVNGGREQAIAFWRDWMAAELRFLDEQRPWERADVIVAGTPAIALGADEWAVARPPLRNSPSTAVKLQSPNRHRDS